MNTETLQLKVKFLTPTAKVPTKAHPTDLGWDLYADQGGETAWVRRVIEGYKPTIIGTGVSLTPPEGYGIIIKERSGLAVSGLRVGGGVIDPGYTGEIKVIVTTASHEPIVIQSGMKIAQAILVPLVVAETVVVDDLSVTDRGEKGFGSSGA